MLHFLVLLHELVSVITRHLLVFLIKIQGLLLVLLERQVDVHETVAVLLDLGLNFC